MPLSQRRTLTRYLIGERRRHPGAIGELDSLVLDVATACKAIARIVAFGELGDALGRPTPASQAAVDVCRVEQKPLDVLANEIFLRTNERNGHFAGMASAKMAEPAQIPALHPRGKYLLVFDPLDGSSDIDVNASVGSVFSILRAPADVCDSGRDVTDADFLQPGAMQVAAGYAIYGAATMLVLSVGNGVAGFTLNPNLGEFMLTHPDIRVPAQVGESAIDASNSRSWARPVRRCVDGCLTGRSTPRARDVDMRGLACLVAEAHRILMRGGVLLHARDTKDPAKAGRLRLLHEANPIGFVIEQAGGRASTGRQPILDLAPASLHQRVGFAFGPREEVDRIERHYRELASPECGVPLFAERSLFRDALPLR